MSDMNFFSSYNKKSEKKTIGKSTAIINGVVILICIGIIGYGTYNLMTIRGLSSEVTALNTQLEASRKDPKIAEILAKEQQVSAMKADLSKVAAMDKYISDSDIIDEFLLEDIRLNTPNEVFLKTMVMSQENIKIDGKSKDKGSIAQFEHNLREIKGLEKVFVSRVAKEDEHYAFYLEIDLKEEAPDGAEAGQQ